jgi:hypothetical protein
MDPAVASDLVGGPVVDHDGAILGLATSESRMLDFTYAQGLLEQRIAAVLASEGEAESGGGFPWVWVGGAGAAAVLAGALLAGGGGGDDDGTGTIILTIPGS